MASEPLKSLKYAYTINSENYRNQLLPTNSGEEANVKTPMELTFFHEVGHFHLLHNRPEKMIFKNDEVDADFYALVIYIRFLRELPEFKTFAESENGKIAEEIYRDYISGYTHLSHFDLAKHMAEKVFKWKVTMLK